MESARQALIDFVAAELAQAVARPVAELAAAARARHGAAVLGVLFHGSCLRRPESELRDGLIDFYLLVDDYRASYGGRLLPALANFLLPPNVFYLEMPWGKGRLRCKYAIISLGQFRRACGADAWNVSIWARFSQESRLVWVRGMKEQGEIAGACAEAVTTMLGNALPLAEPAVDPLALWICALEQTYRAELRSEGASRARAIVEGARARTLAITPMALSEMAAGKIRAGRRSAILAWACRRWLGKALNALRLAKAAFTFEGGLDYILWKVRRHSGVQIAVSDWQRRHPLLSAPLIAWRLYRLGAFR